jgi:mycothiol synthase
MHDLELTGPGGASLGTARVDPTAEPYPRAVVEAAPGASVLELADAILSAMPGHRLIVEDDEQLAEALIGRGVTLARAASLMVLPLDTASPTVSVPGLELAPLRDAPEEYGEIIRRAYPPEHPDHELGEVTPEGAAATARGYLSGEIVGPLLPDASAEARLDGVVVGVDFVSELPADDEFEGGPWITDLCVDPAAQGRGVGRALLGHAIQQLSSTGRDQLGLAVTVGSPARRLYETLGFVELGTRWNLVNEA